jgi:hypothetical protein
MEPKLDTIKRGRPNVRRPRQTRHDEAVSRTGFLHRSR